VQNRKFLQKVQRIKVNTNINVSYSDLENVNGLITEGTFLVTRTNESKYPMFQTNCRLNNLHTGQITFFLLHILSSCHCTFLPVQVLSSYNTDVTSCIKKYFYASYIRNVTLLYIVHRTCNIFLVHGINTELPSIYSRKAGLQCSEVHRSAK
jgi:hypothetical protein